MTARFYRIEDDPRRALVDAIAEGWSAAAPVIMIGQPACLLRFETVSELVLFRLACPSDLSPVEPFELDLVVPIDPLFAHSAFAPILNQTGLADRVRFCPLVDIDLPTDADHDRLLARLRSTGWRADIY